MLVTPVSNALDLTPDASQSHDKQACLELDGNEAIGSHILELTERSLLDEAILSGHEQVGLVLVLFHWQHGSQFVGLFDRQHLHHSYDMVINGCHPCVCLVGVNMRYLRSSQYCMPVMFCHASMSLQEMLSKTCVCCTTV